MSKQVAGNLPYKIIPLAEAFPDYPGGPEAFLPEHGDFVSKPKDAFVILVQDDFISDMAGAFSHEDLLGTLTYPSNDAIFSAILFKKDLHIPNACYLDYDMDYSPALIVEGNLTAKTLNLAGGQTHIKGDCTVSEVLYGHYNHGSLIVDGTTTAPLVIASDYSMTFNGAVKAEYVMSSGSASNMYEPKFNISALGFKLNVKLPSLKKRFLDVSEDFEQIAKIIDEAFLRYKDFDDENINTALNKGDSLFKGKNANPRSHDDYLPDFVLEKLKALKEQVANNEAITTLNFTGCYLKTLPDELRAFPQVEQLIFWNNDLQKLPSWFNEYSALRHLNLSCNSSLVALMLSPQQMAQLESLNIIETRISAITDNSSALSNLIELGFGFKWDDDSELRRFAIDFDWSRTPQLQHLHIAENGWYWTWNDNFSYYQLSHLTYLHHGYVVSGEMDSQLTQLKNLEYYGFVTSWTSDNSYTGDINIETLQSLKKLRVLRIERSAQNFTEATFKAIRQAMPQLYIIAPYIDATFTADAPLIKLSEAFELLQSKQSYRAYTQDNDATALAMFNYVLQHRTDISPKIFQSTCATVLKQFEQKAHACEDVLLKKTRIKHLANIAEQLQPYIPPTASWTHLLEFGAYKLWEQVHSDLIWYALRRADHNQTHMTWALAQLEICLPIGAKTNSNEFNEMYNLANELNTAR